MSSKMNAKLKTCMLSLSYGVAAGAIMLGGMHGLHFGIIPEPGGKARLIEERREARERLTNMYSSVDPGEDLAGVARKVLGHVDSQEMDVSYYDDGRNVTLRVTFSEAYFRNDIQDNWVLTLCFTDEQLEGAYFGTVDAVDVSPDTAPSPKGECTWSPA